MSPTKQPDWRQNWAGGDSGSTVPPSGRLVTLVKVAGAEFEWSSEAQDVGAHYPIPAPRPRLTAGDGPDSVLIESDGTDFGVFSSAREGWKSISFTLPKRGLAGCTGLYFSVRSEESYDSLVVRISEDAGPDGDPGSVYSARFDLIGDGAWHDEILPLFGDRFRTGAFQPARQLDVSRARRISLVLPYHRPLSFSLRNIRAYRVPDGDVPYLNIYPIVEVADSVGDFRGERRQRSGIADLAWYEDLAIQAQSLNGSRSTAGEALALCRAADFELQMFSADFFTEHLEGGTTCSRDRAEGAIRHAQWANLIEIDRLAAWQSHDDGEIARLTPFVPDQYRDYPVEIASIAYWSEGLRVTGTLARPNRPGRYPLCLMNHGYGSFSKDHMIQIMRAASAGFVVFASDYRGQGESEGRQTRNADSIPAMARDVVNGANSVLEMPFVDPTRVVMWGHSMGGGVSWNVLGGSRLGRRILAYAQISSGEPRVSDESLKFLDCQVLLTAGGMEERAVAALPNLETAMRRIGLSFESKVFDGYSHHGMKYQASLAEALAFLRRHAYPVRPRRKQTDPE